MSEIQQETTAGIVVVNMDEFPRKWGWMLALGLLMILAGAVGLYLAVAVTLMTVLLYGGMIMAGGFLSLAHSFQAKEEKWQGRLMQVLLALLYIGAGVIIFINPTAASAALTLVLGAMFLTIGVVRLANGFKCRSNGWKWLLPVVTGLVDVLFAVIIAVSWPISGLWVIGLFVSIELMMYGWSLTFTALAVRKLATNSKE